VAYRLLGTLSEADDAVQGTRRRLDLVVFDGWRSAPGHARRDALGWRLADPFHPRELAGLGVSLPRRHLRAPDQI
jgi:Arc/MetJ family transcription regulator